jgi:hypothetical protein
MIYFLDRFILTAAHCSCDQLPCKKDAGGGLKPEYDPKGQTVSLNLITGGSILETPLVRLIILQCSIKK